MIISFGMIVLFLACREQRARMDVDEPTAKAVGGEILPMIFVVSKAIEYIKNQILDRVVSHCVYYKNILCSRIWGWFGFRLMPVVG